MKQFKIILGLVLFASVTTFAQSPRIKLNQITKDTVKGSVLISSPTDSGMVYSRDFYIAYGADTVLILYGDTITGGGGLSSVLSDGVTITGDGTTGNELKVDTSIIATIKALNDSLANVSASTTPDGVTITGDGSVGNPLKVDTATVISTIQGFLDTLTNRNYLTANQTITLLGDVTGSGTTAITATVVDDSHNHIISNVDNLQTTLDSKLESSDLTNYVTTNTTQTITGAKSFSANTNFDSGTLYVDASQNRVGIGTTAPGVPLQVNGNARFNGLSIGIYNAANTPVDLKFNSTSPQIFRFWNEGTGGAKMRFISDNNAEASHQWTVSSAWLAQIAAGYDGTNENNNYMDFRVRGASDAGTEAGLEAATKMTIKGNGNVGIGTAIPSYTLDVVGDINASGEVRNSGVILTSDARYKKDITTLYNATDKLMVLNPVSYYWNDLMLQKMEESKSKTKTSIKYGLVAQEVEAIMPEFVSTGEDGYKAIDYQAIITLLIKSNQEQQTEIDQLKTLITDLTNRLTILENK